MEVQLPAQSFGRNTVQFIPEIKTFR